MTPWGPSDGGPVERVAAVLARPAERLTVVVVCSYASAVAGLGVLLVGGADPQSDRFTVGLLLLVFSFLSLFYVSVTVLDAGDG